MAMESFTRELDELIRKHLGTPKWGEDFQVMATALHRAAEQFDERADRYPWREDLVAG